MAIAGKVAITPGYEWSADVNYDKLVVVTFGNNVYLSTKPSTGIEPTNEEYWMLLIENVTAEDLENIINGTTPVAKAKDADTLDGKHAEDFLSSGGGTVIGDITIEKSGQPRFFVRNPDIDRFAQFYMNEGGQVGIFNSLISETVTKNTTTLILDPATTENLANLLRVTRAGIVYNVLHTGNKPTGTYTGNGSATSRTIATGGIGTMLYLRATGYSAIVLESGAIVLKSDGTAQYIPYQQATFKTGKLTLKTDGILNANGTVVTYTVH